MEKKLIIVLMLFCPFLSYSQEPAPIDRNRAISYQIRMVQHYYGKGDWLSIVKISKLFLQQEEKDLALQTIVWAERIITSRQTIEGAYHLVSFYKSAKVFKKQEEWERNISYWQKLKESEWKNS